MNLKSILIPNILKPQSKDINADQLSAAMSQFGVRLQDVSTDISTNSIVEACIVNTLQGITGGRLTIVDSQGLEVNNHPALQFVDNALLSNMIRSTYYCGNGIATIVRHEDYSIAKLQYLPYKNLKISRRGNLFNGHTVFDYSPSGTLASQASFVENDVVDFTLEKNMDKPWLGRSPLTAVIDELKTDKAVKVFTVGFLRNYAHPGFIAMPEKGTKVGLDSATITKLAVQFKSKFTGENVGNAMVSPQYLDVFELKGPKNNADLTSIIFIPESRIAAVMHNPPAVVGLLVGQHYTQTNATMSELRREFAEGTIQPLQENFCEQLTTQFLHPHFANSNGFRFAYNNDKNYYFQVDVDKQWYRYEQGFISGALTLNETRIPMGHPPVENGDRFLWEIRSDLQLAANEVEPTINDPTGGERGPINNVA